MCSGPPGFVPAHLTIANPPPKTAAQMPSTTTHFDLPSELCDAQPPVVVRCIESFARRASVIRAFITRELPTRELITCDSRTGSVRAGLGVIRCPGGLAARVGPG